MFKESIFPKRKKEKKKIPWILIIFGIVAFIFVSSIVSYYNYIFRDFIIDADVADFGMFGDFIGGTLNPILAFLSFIALLYTIKIQIDELEATRKELKESRIAQQEQSESLHLQNKAVELQIFENTFFQLLNQHNEYLDLVVNANISINYFNHIEDEFGEYKHTILISEEKIFEQFRNKNQTNRTLKNYFMTLYQILKYINDYAIRNNINAKFYTNIIRALIDDEILRLLAINCVAYPSFTKYKGYIEKYAFFEHIYLDEKRTETVRIVEILSKYKLSAFDKNEELKKLIEAYLTASSQTLLKPEGF